MRVILFHLVVNSIACDVLMLLCYLRLFRIMLCYFLFTLVNIISDYFMKIFPSIDQGPVVRKLISANPGLRVNQGFNTVV